MPFISSGLQRFLNGDFFGGILAPYVAVLGNWVYGIMFGVLLGMLYFRTQNAAIPTVVFIVLMPIVLFFIPAEAWPVYGVFLVLSIAGSLAKAYLLRG